MGQGPAFKLTWRLLAGPGLSQAVGLSVLGPMRASVSHWWLVRGCPQFLAMWASPCCNSQHSSWLRHSQQGRGTQRRQSVTRTEVTVFCNPVLKGTAHHFCDSLFTRSKWLVPHRLQENIVGVQFRSCYHSPGGIHAMFKRGLWERGRECSRNGGNSSQKTTEEFLVLLEWMLANPVDGTLHCELVAIPRRKNLLTQPTVGIETSAANQIFLLIGDSHTSHINNSFSKKNNTILSDFCDFLFKVLLQILTRMVANYMIAMCIGFACKPGSGYY